MEKVKRIYFEGWLSWQEARTNPYYWERWTQRIEDWEKQGMQAVIFTIPNRPGFPEGMLNGDALYIIQKILEDHYGKTLIP